MSLALAAQACQTARAYLAHSHPTQTCQAHACRAHSHHTQCFADLCLSGSCLLQRGSCLVCTAVTAVIRRTGPFMSMIYRMWHGVLCAQLPHKMALLPTNYTLPFLFFELTSNG
eukprot:1157684-Pelagomonas_calceolata.AAC.4